MRHDRFQPQISGFNLRVVVGVFDEDQLRVGNPIGQFAARCHEAVVLVADYDQGWTTDLSQPLGYRLLIEFSSIE